MKRKLTIVLVSSLLLSGCGGSGLIQPGPPAPGPSLSWSASFVSGTQYNNMTFPAVGQTAVLTATQVPGVGLAPPYAVSVSGGCVSVSPNQANPSVTVTADAAGTCVIQVGTSSITAVVQ